MRIIYTLIFTILLSAIHAQESFLKYYDFKSEYGNVHGLCRVGDEIVGSGIFWDTFLSPHKQNILVYKTDLNGQLSDYKYYRDEDTSVYGLIIVGPLYFQGTLAIDDTSFIICYYNLKKHHLEIFKFNLDLVLLKKSVVPVNNLNHGVFPVKLYVTGGEIYLIGFEEISADNEISFIYKFNFNLELIWKRLIPDIKQVRTFEYNNILNEFVFSEYDKGDEYVITDTLLNTKRTKKLPDGLSDVYHENLEVTKDGRFLTSSYNLNGSPNFTLNIVNRDENFNTVWKFGMGGIPGYKASVVNIIPSSDDAYFAYGQIGARTADIRDIYSSLDSIDIIILSTVKFREDGKILWQRFDTLETGYYNLSYADCGGMVAADDGGLYISGKITCYDTIRVNEELKRIIQYKYFLMKIDSNGCIEGLHCNVEPKTETVLSAMPGITAADDRLRIYPNPGTGRITVTRDEHTRSGLLTVYDAHGVPLISRKVYPGSEEIQLDLTGRPPGRYYATVRQEDGKIVTGSFILVR